MRARTTARIGLTALLVLSLLALATTSASALSITKAPQKPVHGEPVTFTALDPPANATQWHWDFGDRSTTDQAHTTNHTYTGPGRYHVRLQVQDDEGRNTTATLDVDIHLHPPTLLPVWLYWFMPGLVGLGLLAIGLMVLLRGQPAIYNRVFFLLYAASGLKGLTESIFYFIAYQSRGTVEQLLPWLAAERAVGFLYPHLFLWFVLVFPRPLRPWLKNGWSGAIVLLLSLPFFLLEFVLNVNTIGLFNGYVSILALFSLGLLVYHAWETDSREERHRIRLLAGTFFLLVLVTILVTLFQFTHQEDLRVATGVIGSPILEIFGCVLLMYAILRYQLMGVELFLKRATRATAFAICIGAIFIIVSNSVEQLFQVKFLAGLPLDFIIAGFLSTLMMYPIQKLTERIANRMFPNASNPGEDHLAVRRMEIYEAQLRYALLDGTLKDKELSMLHALRDSLGLHPEELRRVAQRFPNANLTLLMSGPRLRTA